MINLYQSQKNLTVAVVLRIEKIMQKHQLASNDVEHRVHLNRAADYIQDHFAEDLSLEKLAGIAHFSKFHFHRLFRQQFGETIHNYIRLLRLEHAARQLTTDAEASIAAVADACGFSSPQNFTRAFKAHFGFPPKAMRRASDLQIINASIIPANREDSKMPLNIEIKILAPQRVAYIRHVGAYRSASNMQAAYRLTQWAMAKGITRRSLPPIALAWNDPATTPDHECVCDMCLMVADEVEGEGEVKIQYLPGGKFAVLRSEIKWEEVTAVRNRFFYEWLPPSGYQKDEKPYYFIYYNNHHMNPRKLVLLDICLPVGPA